MAAPMSFLPRVIIGATTFAVVVAGTFYLYYRSRHIFRRKPSKALSPDKPTSSQYLDSTTEEADYQREVFQALASYHAERHERDNSIISLILLLESDDESQLCKVLTTVANKAAFTEEQNAVRFAGGLPVIMRLLERDSDRVRTCAATCIANLALNNHNQPVLKCCIPTLLALSTDPLHTKGLRLASIQALVNLSVSGQCGELFSYPGALHSLFALIGDGSTSLGQQALRVLVNLSADETVVPTLLGFQVPGDFTTQLEPHHTPESLLRMLSFLINLRSSPLASVGGNSQVTNASRGSSFRDLLIGGADELKVAVETLVHHGNTNVEQQARRLLAMLSAF
ncbi:armadillo repeat-containing protein 10-like [Acanthaster planci]|uniref:Armadillo repeat-containing protein 10-like n=1 Tax=Acanthaster planci TaxID=133434 RepID=A0A8B7XM30_ACAPL|nr:armadillo repeat-containing protein 10-like [Acanthaster planci]